MWGTHVGWNTCVHLGRINKQWLVNIGGWFMGQVAEGQVQNLSWLFIAALTNAIFSADIHCPCFEQNGLQRPRVLQSEPLYNIMDIIRYTVKNPTTQPEPE